MPRPTTIYHHPPPAKIYPPRPTTIYHHPPPAKIYPLLPTTSKKNGPLPSKSQNKTSFRRCFNSFFFFEMQYFFPRRRFCVIKFWSVRFSNSKFLLHSGLLRLLRSPQISSNLKYLLKSPLISSKNVNLQENLLKSAQIQKIENSILAISLLNNRVGIRVHDSWITNQFFDPTNQNLVKLLFFANCLFQNMVTLK